MILRRSLPVYGEAALQSHVGKAFRISASILEKRTILYSWDVAYRVAGGALCNVTCTLGQALTEGFTEVNT